MVSWQRGHPDCLPLQLVVQAPFTTLLLTNFAAAPVRLLQHALVAVAEPVDYLDDLTADPDTDLDSHGTAAPFHRPPPDDVRLQAPYLEYIRTHLDAPVADFVQAFREKTDFRTDIWHDTPKLWINPKWDYSYAYLPLAVLKLLQDTPQEFIVIVPHNSRVDHLWYQILSALDSVQSIELPKTLGTGYFEYSLRWSGRTSAVSGMVCFCLSWLQRHHAVHGP